jgi:stage II sporulation SpoAA-like protein
MLEHSLDAAQSILTLRPKTALTQADFTELARTVDPFIEAHGMLAGILIEAASFPGWDSFGALVAHLRFVRDHHRRVRKIAVVTDTVLGELAEKLASHFVSAEIKHFPAGQSEAARRWILNQISS